MVLLKLWSSKTAKVCWYFKGSLRRIGGIGDSKGKPLKVASVYDMLNRMEKKTGIKNTPHMLRHYFANMRKEAGWRLEMISQALGHKHLDTTIRYLDWIDDDLVEASNEFYEQHAAIFGAERLLQ